MFIYVRESMRAHVYLCAQMRQCVDNGRGGMLLEVCSLAIGLMCVL